MCVENEFVVRGSTRADRAEEFGGPIPTHGFGGGVTVSKLFPPLCTCFSLSSRANYHCFIKLFLV